MIDLNDRLNLAFSRRGKEDLKKKSFFVGRKGYLSH